MNNFDGTKLQLEKWHLESELEQKGIEAEEQGNIPLAIEHYENVVALGAELPVSYMNLCGIYRKKKRYDDEIRIALAYREIFDKNDNKSYKAYNWADKDLYEVEQLKNNNSIDPDGYMELEEYLYATSYPSSNGLKPPEILMLYYASTYKTSNNKFQKFWFSEYGIRNPNEVLTALFNGGFIRIATIEESLSTLKLAELKDICFKLNLKTKGKKDDLINSICQYSDRTVLNTLVTDRTYALTDLGKEELSTNQYVPFLHKSQNIYGVDIWWANKKIYEYPNMSFRDILWGELNRQSLDAMKEIAEINYYSYILNRISMCNFCIEMDKNYLTAFKLLCEAIYYDVNANTYGRWAYQKRVSGSEEVDVLTCMNIPIKLLKKVQSGLNYNQDKWFEEVISEFSSYKLLDKYRAIITNTDLAGIITALTFDDVSASVNVKKVCKSILENFDIQGYDIPEYEVPKEYFEIQL